MRARRAVFAVALAGPAATALAACFLFPSFDGVTRDYGRDAAATEGGAGDAIGTGCDADLANDMHACGACGHDCFGGGCDGGRCQPIALAAGGGVPNDLAVDDAYAYWTAGTAVWQAALHGNPEAGPLVADTANPTYVAVDDGYVVWTDNVCSQGTGTPCTVRARDKQTGVVVTLDPDAGSYPSGVAVGGAYVFWPVEQQNAVRSTPEDGGGVAIQLNLPSIVLAQAQNVVLAGSSVYVDVSNYGGSMGGIVQMPRVGGPPQAVRAALAGQVPELFTPLASNGTLIAWVGVDDAGVARSVTTQDVGSGLFSIVAPVTGTTPVALTMDLDHLYWVTAGAADAGAPAGTLVAAPLDGGPSTTLATGIDVATSGYTRLGRLVSGSDSVF
ncbi:MAG TPA: hypothetical protein VIY73_28145, partial [Polyangiaceae bacterium]